MLREHLRAQETTVGRRRFIDFMLIGRRNLTAAAFAAIQPSFIIARTHRFEHATTLIFREERNKQREQKEIYFSVSRVIFFPSLFYH